MAIADYYLCDLCNAKTFYDADLSYENKNSNPKTGKPWPDGNVGYMFVICKECARTIHGHTYNNDQRYHGEGNTRQK